MTNTNETLSHDSIIESLEQAKKTLHIDKHTLDQAREVLKDPSLSPEKSIKIQELITHLDNLSNSTKTEVQSTLSSVEMNPEDTLKNLENINTSGDLSKVTPEFTKNLQKQLDFCKDKHPEKYIKLIVQLVELSVIYDTKLTNKETSKINHLDNLLDNQTKEFEIILTETSLDLENNTLERNLELFTSEKNSTKKNVILDYIYEEEIEKKGYNVKYDEKGTYAIVDNTGKEVNNPEIILLKKSVLSVDLKSHKEYQQTKEYNLINNTPILGNLTVAQIIQQSPKDTQQKYKKLSETTLGKLAVPGLIISFLFGMWGKHGGALKRVGLLLLGGIGLKSANEMGYDLTGGLKDIIDDATSGLTNSNETKKLRPWDQEKAYTNTYNNLLEENNKNTDKVPETFIKSFFGFCYSSESFKSNNIGSVKSYINGSGTTNIQDIFGEDIPKSSTGVDIPETEIKKFLSLLVTQEETNDTFGKDLLKQGEVSKKKNTLSGGAYKKPVVNENLNGGSDKKPIVNENLNGGSNKKPVVNENLNGGSDKKPIVNENLNGGSNKKPVVNENLNGGSNKKPEKKNNLNGGLSQEDIINNELIRYETIGFLEPGKELFLAADKSDTGHYYEQLAPEIKDAMFAYKVETIKVENLLFIIQNITVNEDKPELNKELRNQLLTSVNEVNIFDFKNTIPQLNNTILNVISNLPEDSLDLTDRISVLSYIREQGNTDAVATEIVSKNFHELDISDEDINNYIATGIETEEIEILLKEDSDLFEKISKKHSEIKQYIAEIQDTLLPEYKELYPNLNGAEILKRVQDSIIQGYTKGLFYETHLASKMSFLQPNLNSTNVEANLFAEMRGIGTFDFSDENNALFTKEAITFVAVQALAIGAGLVTMGAGTVAINALVYGTKAGKVFKTIATTASATGTGFRQGGKILGAQAARVAGMGVVNGLSFYTGYATVHGINSDALANGEFSYENAHSMDGYINSAMFGVVSRAFQGLKLGNMLTKVGKNKAGKFVLNHPKKFSGLALAGAFGINETLPEEIQLEPGEWSKEEIMSVLMFVGSFYFKLPRSGYNKATNHTAGQNFKFSRGNGNVQVQMGPPRPNPVTPPKPGLHNHPNAQPYSTTKVISKKLKKVGQKIKDTFKF